LSMPNHAPTDHRKSRKIKYIAGDAYPYISAIGIRSRSERTVSRGDGRCIEEEMGGRVVVADESVCKQVPLVRYL
jgi:hypothetical protein